VLGLGSCLASKKWEACFPFHRASTKIQNMFVLSDEENSSLAALGMRLKSARERFHGNRRERQSDFAARVGVSVPTYRKMEKGDPGVPIGYWVRALWLLDRLDELDGLIAPADPVFDALREID
jgi:DNA-binding XRE family transcriptional regulator